MNGARFITRIPALLPALALPGRATADTTGSDGATSASTASTWGGAVSIMLVVLILIVAIGVAIKLYDHKRKREEEALSAQAYLADVFLREFGTMPIVASVSGSLWRSRSPLVFAIQGTVPTPELREAVMQLAKQELSRQYPTAQTDDRLLVDPLIMKERAERVSS